MMTTLTDNTEYKPDTERDSGTNGTNGTVGIGVPKPAGQQPAPVCAREGTGTSGTRPAPEQASVEVAVTGSTELDMTESATSGEVAELPEPARATVPVSARVGAHARRAHRYGRGLVQMPHLWRSPSTSPADRVAYAQRSEHLPPGGAWRTVLLGYHYLVSVPAAVAAHAVAWWLERPARAVPLLITLVAVWPTPVGQAIASAAAWVVTHWADWIVL